MISLPRLPSLEQRKNRPIEMTNMELLQKVIESLGYLSPQGALALIRS